MPTRAKSHLLTRTRSYPAFAALFAFAKSVLDYVAFVIPFYAEANIAIVTFLAFGGGAELAYKVLRPIIKEHEATIDSKLMEATAKAAELKSEAVKKAEELAHSKAE